MYLGFLTGCLGNMPLKEKAKWASKNGFKALEVSCWPRENARDYSGSDIDVANLTKYQADEIKEYFKEYDLTISSIAYYDNNLDRDPEKRKYINNHVKKCMDAAAMLGVDMVGTFIGKNIDKDIKGNFDEFQEVFKDIVDYAGERGIRIIIENCHMPNWQVKGLPGTISYTPELWEEMFSRVPQKNFGLNYDPSHLHAMLMDYVSPIKTFRDRIFHFHAKDAEVFENELKYYGVCGRQLDVKSGHMPGYWRYRMPGLGQIDWARVIGELKGIGYEGVVSIEHEDLLYEGSEAKIKEGLVLGKKNLEQFVK